MRYFHGGAPGLRAGDRLLPPNETGASTLADHGSAVTRRDRVYVTSKLLAAKMWAAGHPSGRGFVYEVRPEGDVEHDPDCTEIGLSFECRSAVIVRVIPMLPRERLEILRALVADASRGT